MRKRQWYQDELPFALGEPTADAGIEPLGWPHGPGDNPHETMCTECGWPVDQAFVTECDVHNCPVIHVWSTFGPQPERQCGEG